MALTRPRYSSIVDTDYKASCRVVTTTNITLSGGAPNSYDSVSLVAGDRILVAGQSTASQNGIYIVQTLGTGSNGTWIRSFDANTSDRVTAGMTTAIEEGSNVGKTWRLTTGNPIVLGTTALTFVDSSGGGGGVAGANRNIQYNDSGSSGGASDFLYWSANGNVTIGSTTNSSNANTGALVVKGGVGITGNLFVLGNVITSNLLSIASHTLNVQDPLLYLTANTTYPYQYDIGFFSQFVGGDSNVYQHTGVVRDYTTNQWKLFSNVASEPGATINWSDPGLIYDNLRLGSLLVGSNIEAVSGNITVVGNINPAANVTYNLGSPTQRWKDIWLSGNTIYLGPEAMSVDSSGKWSFTSAGATVNMGANVEFNPPAANIAGNVTANALRTATGLYWSGNGNPISGITFTTANTAPAGANRGDKWYDTDTDILYEYIPDGDSSQWVDVSSPDTQTNFTASPTAPTSPLLGDSWYDTDTDILFLRINDGSSNVWVDIGSASANIPNALVANTITVQQSITVNSANLATAIVNAGTAGTGNIGATGAGFNTVFARATSAQYADLAEKYVADYNYTAGTVVVFGGDQEITVTTQDHDTRVAGVISTNPAYIMNDAISGLPVALTGRVPCRVLGPVNKGDLLVTSKLSGTAQRCITERYAPGCILGKSLENIMTSEVKTIEIAVGRF